LETTRSRLKRGVAKLRERLSRELGTDERPWALALAPLIGNPKATAAGFGAAAGGAAMATTTTKAAVAAAILLLLVGAGVVAARRSASDGAQTASSPASPSHGAPTAPRDDEVATKSAGARPPRSRPAAEAP